MNVQDMHMSGAVAAQNGVRHIRQGRVSNPPPRTVNPFPYSSEHAKIIIYERHA